MVLQSSRNWYVVLRPTGTQTLQAEDMKVFSQKAWNLSVISKDGQCFPGEPGEKGTSGTTSHDYKGMLRNQKH